MKTETLRGGPDLPGAGRGVLGRGDRGSRAPIPDTAARRLAVAFSDRKTAVELEFQFESGPPGWAGRGVGFRGPGPSSLCLGGGPLGSCSSRGGTGWQSCCPGG